MKYRIKTKYLLGIIFLVGLILRILFWRTQKGLIWDEAGHSIAGVMIARTILNGFSFDYAMNFISNYFVTVGSLFFYPYGYDIMSTISFLIFGFNDFAARFPNMFFSLLIIHAVYIVTKKMFNSKIALFAAFFAAINPYFIIWGGGVVNDVIMITFMLYAIYFCLKAVDFEYEKRNCAFRKRNGLRNWILCGMFIGLAGLIKPPGLIVSLFVAFIVFYRLGWRSLFGKKFLILILIAVFLTLTYFGQGWIGKYILPQTGLISQELGDSIYSNVYHWFGSALTHYEAGDQTWRELGGWTYYLGVLSEQLGGNIAIIFAFFGLIFLSRFKDDSSKKNMVLILFYITLVFIIFVLLDNKNQRYTMPYIPFLIILMSFGFYSFIKFVKVSKRTEIVLVILLMVSFLISTIGVILSLEYTSTQTTGLNEAIEYISNSEPGLVVDTFGDQGYVNVQTISYYLAMKDPDLEYSVYWLDKDSLKRSKYIIARGKVYYNVEKVFTSTGGELNVYKIK
jgi:4-amino-4-deoxy-L-arabinose transferase-like glycosyltransferase